MPRRPNARWVSSPYSERTDEHLWEDMAKEHGHYPPPDSGWARAHTAYGATIADTERGITYVVTLHRQADGAAVLRSVDVRLEYPDDPDAQRVFRSGLPVKSLIAEAAVWATAAERGELADDPENPGIWLREASVGNDGRSRSRPDLKEVAMMVKDGMTRAQIAQEFSEFLGRPVATSTTNRWIADARKAGLIPPSNRPNPNTRRKG